MIKETLEKSEEIIRDHDMFGHVINLNFDQRGDSHRTLCGGFGSLTLKGFLAFYFYLNITKLIWKENDTNITSVGLMDLETFGTVDYDKMHMKFFHSIRKQDST